MLDFRNSHIKKDQIKIVRRFFQIIDFIRSLYDKIAEPIYPDAKSQKKVEVELSTVCISKCFACPRTMNRATDHGWNVGHLKMEVLHEFLKKNSQLKQLVFCGAYGDPIYHPKFIDIIEIINKDYPWIHTFSETNGSHRSESWWEELGKKSSSQNAYSFSLDGLSDTNALHRVGTDWKSIMTGIRTLRLHHKGYMLWKWILFRQNQHQVIEGYRTSVKLGFNEFKIINSVRHENETTPTVDFHQICHLISQEESSSSMLQP